MKETNCCICSSHQLSFLKCFHSLSPGETDLGVDSYYRELWKCDVCSHYMNVHDINLSSLYTSEYWNRTYNQNTEARFRKIMSLPHDQSDNRRRVKFIENFWQDNKIKLKKRLLDIGSGLGVFAAAMKESGWYVAATDPDPRAVEQVKQLGGADQSFIGSFPDVAINEKFGLVTLNKVLEHVPDPIEMLSHAKDYIAKDGWLYVELPDGQRAYLDSPHRQEFFLEHYGAFSIVSMSLLIENSGFMIKKVERLIEPSGKYTLAAFAYLD